MKNAEEKLGRDFTQWDTKSHYRKGGGGTESACNSESFFFSPPSKKHFSYRVIFLKCFMNSIWIRGSTAENVFFLFKIQYAA